MNAKVSIVILNWNGWENTLECLESLHHLNYHHYNIILVDNASKDESIDKIREYCNDWPKSDSFENPCKHVKIIEYTKQRPESMNNTNQIIPFL